MTALSLLLAVSMTAPPGLSRPKKLPDSAPDWVRGEKCWIEEAEGRQWFYGTSAWPIGDSRGEAEKRVRRQAAQHAIDCIRFYSSVAHPATEFEVAETWEHDGRLYMLARVHTIDPLEPAPRRCMPTRKHGLLCHTRGSGSKKSSSRVLLQGDTTCVIDRAGQLTCWGNDHRWPELDAGVQHLATLGRDGCAVQNDGGSICWGCEPTRPGPCQPPEELHSVCLTLGNRCGITSKGELRCWDSEKGVPGKFHDLACALGEACGLDESGGLYCTGPIEHELFAPAPVVPFAAMASNGLTFCGVTHDGAIVCWGNTGHGHTPPQGNDFVQVTVGSMSVCGLRTNGRVTCTGTMRKNRPLPSPAGLFVQVSAGAFHACGMRKNRTLVCWGDNHYGQSDVPARFAKPGAL